MPGRPPTPIAVHKSRGTYKEARHGGKLEVPNVSIGDPPEWMGEVARAEWKRLAKLPHIKAAHSVAVQHACVLYARFVDDAKGKSLMTASERNAFHSVYMQLACTPASQAKIPAVPLEKPDDPWANLG